MAQYSVIKLLWLCFIGMSCQLWAQDSSDEWSDDWGDEWDLDDSPWSQNGFVEASVGHRTQTDVLFSDQASLSEFRWQQEFQYSDEQLDFNWNHNIWLDDVTGGLQFDLRAMNFEFSLFDQTDVVLGRQISTWGTGDLLFINDMFPKDWQSFFSGRDDNYLKAPADAIRVTSYFAAFNMDLVVTPSAEPDRFINGERFSLFSPVARMLVGGQEMINPRNPSQAEYALRLFKQYKGAQLTAYAYSGIEKSPVGLTANLQAYFPRKNVFGASVQNQIGSGLYHIEVGYHQAKEDKDGSKPYVPNSQWRFLLGYERELVSKLNWGVQFYQEHITDYANLLTHSPDSSLEPAENRRVITNRLTYQAKQDKLTWSLFLFYSPTDEDSYWRPSVSYRHNDRWQFNLGANMFIGTDEHTFFGQFEQASNIFARIKFIY